MDSKPTCADCLFMQRRTGLLRTRLACFGPQGRRGQVKPGDPACEGFVLTQRASFGLGALRRGPAGGGHPTRAASQRRAAQATAGPGEGQELRIACDVHTHTVFSRHAYGTIEENVRAASERGIELLGSTDHFSPMTSTLFGADVRPDDLGDVVSRDYQHYLNYACWPKEWHGVRVLRGCEADIVDLEGRLFGWDVPVARRIDGKRLRRAVTLKERVFDACDYAIASVHDDDFAEGATPAQVTAMYVRALEDPKVLILGHVGRSGLDFDLDAVLTAARDLGKMVEINESTFRQRPEATPRCRAIAQRAAELGCLLSTGTDAHISPRIGRLDKTRALLEDVGFPQELLATTDAASFLGALRRALPESSA
ncbi:phosphatase [Olsenella sp. HMSC062G07]|uniref:phosphatase n=1 Tax=Olsenella sp. HMSC062G07 TaxID=1739330 RepID=UPI000A4FA568|nr:phosphatase [Olsenella sp. HMSC062G07]